MLVDTHIFNLEAQIPSSDHGWVDHESVSLDNYPCPVSVSSSVVWEPFRLDHPFHGFL